MFLWLLIEKGANMASEVSREACVRLLKEKGANMEEKDTLGQRHTMVPEVQLKNMKFCWYTNLEKIKCLASILLHSCRAKNSDVFLFSFNFFDGLHAIR